LIDQTTDYLKRHYQRTAAGHAPRQRTDVVSSDTTTDRFRAGLDFITARCTVAA